MKIYLVGGAVRDLILNKTPHDADYVVVGSTPAEMQKLGFKQVGKDFPVFLHPQTKEEYALARKEIKTGNKHTDFKFVFSPDITLEEDIQRRDFTCNGLAKDINSGEIIDFVGGINDIKQKILRHINSEHFGEDPLRVLRMCRFSAQLNFVIASETMNLAKKMVQKGMLNNLSKERIWQEFAKALTSEHFDKFIANAKECGALNIILPEVDKLWQIPERTDYHPEGNSGDHTLLCLQKAGKENAQIKFAVLLHDVGKLCTPQNILPSHYNHEKNGLPLIKDICRRLGAPTVYKNTALLCCENHMVFPLANNIRPATLYDLVNRITGFKNFDNLDILKAVCRCDILGRGGDISAERLLLLEKCYEKCKLMFDLAQKYKVADLVNLNEVRRQQIKEQYRMKLIEIYKQNIV